MASEVFANWASAVGTVTTETTVSLAHRVGNVVITNDDLLNDLSFKFRSSETFSTLKPKETIRITIRTRQVIIDGASVPYRIWGTG